MAEQYNVDLLGALPLDIRIREETDGGKPTVVAEPEIPYISDLPRNCPQDSGQALSAGQGLCGQIPEFRDSEQLATIGTRLLIPLSKVSLAITSAIY